MQVEYTAEQKRLRAEIRAYLESIMTPEMREQTRTGEGGEVYRGVIRKMGRDGWLAPGWPVEYGGRGLDPIAQKISLEEIIRAQAPFSFVTINTVGPCLMRLGTPEQKQQLLPRMARGELVFAIGYTEPKAGSDLAALQTRAVLDGDSFVINGSKVFTSGAEGADYVWLAARTDPDAPVHKGISILMVDTKDPGFSVSPIWAVGEVRTNATYYDNVRVPRNMVVGEINSGWRLITEQLNHERVGLAAMNYASLVCYDQVVEWARSTAAINQPWVKMNLAHAYAILQANVVMGDRVAWEVQQGRLTPDLASATKVFGTESVIDVYRLLLEITGSAGLLKEGSPGALMRGRLELEYRRAQISTYGGGNNDVLRDMLASVGHGMPRSRK